MTRKNADKPPAEETELRLRNEELRILNAVARSLNATANLDESLTVALSSVAELLGLQTGWVWLLDEHANPYLAAAQNLPPALADEPESMEGECYCLTTFQEGDLTGAANVNVITCSRLKWLTEGTAGLRYHASIPLYAHGRKLGVLNVASTEWRRLAPAELQLLHTIGDMLGLAVERARLYARSTEAGALEERNRLAREIHDTLAQGLTAIALKLDAADALLEAGSETERIARMIGEALAMTRYSLEETRRTVLDLGPAPLQGRTLAEAIGELITGTATRGLEVNFEVVGASYPLPGRIEAGLYRIAQQALANVITHAGATHATVRLTILPGKAHLRVEDNGSGFDPAVEARGRYGLVGMGERARLLGGTMRIESSPRHGSAIDVMIPLVIASDSSAKEMD